LKYARAGGSQRSVTMKTFLIIALTLLTATLANAQPPLSADEKAVEDALVRAGIGSREAIHAQMVWSHWRR